ncbi:MAG TPA: PhzF family phenazine biosynthesis protein [Candidatus Aminicenantes bacterium]|nr:PhzF family phenazine biosynthesis protein [Candidatus Aminicenantes bacterium]
MCTCLKIRVNLKNHYGLIEKTSSKLILVFSPETYHKENDLNVRVFGDYYQVPEDPATRSANGCLAGYLVKQRCLGFPVLFLIPADGSFLKALFLFLSLPESEEGESSSLPVNNCIPLFLRYSPLSNSLYL